MEEIVAAMQFDTERLSMVDMALQVGAIESGTYYRFFVRRAVGDIVVFTLHESDLDQFIGQLQTLKTLDAPLEGE